MKFALLFLLLPLQAIAQDRTDILTAALQEHILPNFRELAVASQDLENAAVNDCAVTSEPLRDAYHAAFDAWISASHLRFGPTETNNRAFALAYWPDPKAFTPKILTRLIADEDPIVDDPTQFVEVSIAGRGFYALDALVFDHRYTGNPEYICRLIGAITYDISDIADAMLAEWEDEYSNYILSAGSVENPIYFTQDEAMQDLLASIITGLEFTKDKRIARPLGTFDRPRPNRADARRSGRAQRNIILSLEAVKDLTNILMRELGGGVPDEVNATLDLAIRQAREIENPAEITTASRFALEALQSSISSSHLFIVNELQPALGVAAGFNALDGD